MSSITARSAFNLTGKAILYTVSITIVEFVLLTTFEFIRDAARFILGTLITGGPFVILANVIIGTLLAKKVPSTRLPMLLLSMILLSIGLGILFGFSDLWPLKYLALVPIGIVSRTVLPEKSMRNQLIVMSLGFLSILVTDSSEYWYNFDSPNDISFHTLPPKYDAGVHYASLAALMLVPSILRVSSK